MKKLAFAAIAASLMATPAFAQEAEGLGGFKLGALVGYDSLTFKVDGESDSKGGLGYGVVAGYDFDAGGAIVGLEAEYADSTAKYSERDIETPGDEASIHAGRDLYVGARLGVPVSANMLVYAKGGYANASIKMRYDDGTDAASISENVDGFRLGAGAEYVSGPMFARAEYRYSDYGSFKYEGIDTGLKVSRHQGIVAVGYRF